MQKTPRLRLIIFVYWFLLIYIVAALVWWFIALQQQNNKMSSLLISELDDRQPTYTSMVVKIENDKKRKTSQYIGEGTTFLALILIGAVFVYRATRRQLRLSMQQQNFMMAVTHELKTPIAVARLNIETLQKRKLEEVQQQKLITITLQEVNRLDSLCNNILLASQLDAGQYKPEKTEVNLSNVAKKTLRDFSSRYAKRNIKSYVKDDITIMGEELLLEMLISNLIENAIKYTPPEAEISVELYKKNQCVLLKVADGGPGIIAEEKDKIFQKFYRIGNETTRTAKGTGLGLYLCRQIAKEHHAAIDVMDNINKGAVFTVNFKNINL